MFSKVVLTEGCWFTEGAIIALCGGAKEQSRSDEVRTVGGVINLD